MGMQERIVKCKRECLENMELEKRMRLGGDSFFPTKET